ncbi:hypothetical protein PQO01_05380 [Lentisphaera marina]|uniref:hypothetical protein n=1 Tax=Lentisphaera marina TaxID=1111041 RepID=UPI002366AA3B|nr:hypothetical protein [Lentisphaera marina]MDD7984378.1 hypothetical protein [Lentisphaera marina]
MSTKIKCPKCGKDMLQSNLYQVSGTVCGGAIFGLAGFMARNIATKTIVTAGASVVAGPVGGIAGAVAGCAAGAAVGNRVGKHIDEEVVMKYKCIGCDAELKL